ncbi:MULTISPECIES: hypothetical protein [unclassified Kribbella]|uniref:hypothetical protein n=1 Tax=unclassified Kribbella TaxID=2644121 RepID=UPI003077FEEF
MCSDPVGKPGNIPALVEEAYDWPLTNGLHMHSRVTVNRNSGGIAGSTHTLNTNHLEGFHARVMAVLKNGCGEVIYVTPPEAVGVDANQFFLRWEDWFEWTKPVDLMVTQRTASLQVVNSRGGNDTTDNFNRLRGLACSYWEAQRQACPIPTL